MNIFSIDEFDTKIYIKIPSISELFVNFIRSDVQGLWDYDGICEVMGTAIPRITF